MGKKHAIKYEIVYDARDSYSPTKRNVVTNNCIIPFHMTTKEADLAANQFFLSLTAAVAAFDRLFVFLFFFFASHFVAANAWLMNGGIRSIRTGSIRTSSQLITIY